jgi:hypothetical protein
MSPVDKKPVVFPDSSKKELPPVICVCDIFYPVVSDLSRIYHRLRITTGKRIQRFADMASDCAVREWTLK